MMVVLCETCGQPLPPETQRSTTVDWSEGVKPPKPVRWPTRAEAMADGRVTAWMPVSKVPPPLDRPIIIASPREVSGGYYIARARWNPAWRAWCDPDASTVKYSAKTVTHWREDTVGSPLS